MKIYLKLVSALIKTVEPSAEEKYKKKIFTVVMSVIALFGIMIPMAFLVGVIIYFLTTSLMQIGGQAQAVELFIHIVSIFSFVFGLNVIFSVFYFSGDIESLLPLPLKSHQIILSKFTAALINESVMEFIILIAAFAGYIIAGGLPLYSWLIAVLGTLTLPIIPLTYCGILAMLMMLFTHRIKNKDTVNKITGFLTVAVIVVLLVMVGNIGGLNTDSIVKSISAPSNGFLAVMNCIFPHVRFITDALSTNSILNFAIYIVINILAVLLFLLIAKGIYFKTVVGMSGSIGSRHKSSVSAINRLKNHSVTFSYLAKEFKILIRTPAYFMNCILINLLWPVFLYLIVILQGQTNFLSPFVNGLNNGDELSYLMLIVAVSGISVLVTAANCISSSAFTREGKHFAFIKYIPVPYMKQINIKALTSIIISGGCMTLFVIIAGILINLDVGTTALCIVISLLSVCFVSYFGIYMDTVNPKLIWDDELNALRGNYNIFFNMALAILLEAVVCAGAYLLFIFTSVGATAIISGMTLILAVLNIFSYILCLKKATQNIDTLSI